PSSRPSKSELRSPRPRKRRKEQKQSANEHALLPSSSHHMHNDQIAVPPEFPMSLQAYLAFVAACIALALLPGPVVTLLIANGLRHGTRAALINCAGVQTAMAIVIGIVAIGLTSLMATMGYWFDWVRFAGAAYLVWLGIKLIRSPVEGVNTDDPRPPRG